MNEGALSAERLEKIRALNRIAESREQTLAQMALAWVYRHEGITGVLIGASKPEQIIEDLDMIKNLHFSEEELAEIDRAERDMSRLRPESWRGL